MWAWCVVSRGRHLAARRHYYLSSTILYHPHTPPRCHPLSRPYRSPLLPLSDSFTLTADTLQSAECLPQRVCPSSPQLITGRCSIRDISKAECILLEPLERYCEL